MMRDEPEWNVFLCHNSQEKPHVEEIRHHLQDQGIKTWLDKYDFEPFRPWQDQLEEVIDQVKSAAIFVGSSGVGPWEDIEMRLFLDEFVSRKLRMGLVILPGCSNEIIDRVPRFYKHFHRVDFRQQSPDPMGQLFWGITGQRLTEHLSDKLEKLICKKNGLEQEIKEIEQRLDRISSLENRVDSSLDPLLDWLSSRESIAERCGAKALEKFPRLKLEVKRKDSLSKFFLEISTCLEFISMSIARDNIIFVNEPALPPTLADSNMYKSADSNVYEEAFRLIKDRIPPYIDISIKSKLEARIDYAVLRLLMDARNSGV
ncbi:toll/interleukin-1 receptor domain-containing protein [Phormidesmis sp. 146-12]